MNDQVGELCLFTDHQNVVLGSLCSVVKLNNLNPELCGFIESLNNLLNNDKRIAATFGLSELLIYFCALIVLSSLLSLLYIIDFKSNYSHVLIRSSKQLGDRLIDDVIM